MKNNMNTYREKVMTLYKKLYEDAKSKNFPEKYLKIVYKNGESSYADILEIAENCMMYPLELLEEWV